MLLAEQPKINLAIGLHYHQPVGNWDGVIEKAYAASYLPFVETLERHPGVRICAHYTGYLLEWLGKHHPEFIDRIRSLVTRGQIELISGAFYEPILSIIPDEDKVGQIRRLTRFIIDRLGDVPEGMWLAERVWEPHLIKPISEAGMAFTLLDGTLFKAAGLRDTDLYGYYQSEEQGKQLQIFPINQELRYLIPYAAPEKVIDHLRAIASPDGSRLVVGFEEGEKFGGWPGTHQSVFTDGWLDRFFTLLENNADWINVTTLRGYRQKHQPWGRIYLPSGSYPEMQEWALPYEQATLLEEARQNLDARFHDFLRGGYWRNFLVKYPESNNLHKKMLRVAAMVASASQVGQLVPAGGHPEAQDDWQQAQDALWKGQSNDPYWHGIFGGLYLSHLRSANYSNLLQAETLCDRMIHGGKDFLSVEQYDFDGDGAPEVLISSATQNLYFTREGGSLFELDFKPTSFNLLDTLARRHEPYHQRIGQGAAREPSRMLQALMVVKEPGLEKMVFHDWYRRISYIDHFLHPDSHLESFYNVSYGEQGDFVNQPYRTEVEEDGDQAVLTMTRDGHVWVGSEFWPVTVSKRFVVPRRGGLTRVTYTLSNGRDDAVDLWFGVEFNLNLLSGNDPNRRYLSSAPIEDSSMGSKGSLQGISDWGVRDEVLGLDYRLRWNVPAHLWRFPVETVSQSEAGFERVYQGSSFMPHWRLHFGPRSSWSLDIEQHLSEL